MFQLAGVCNIMVRHKLPDLRIIFPKKRKTSKHNKWMTHQRLPTILRPIKGFVATQMEKFLRKSWENLLQKRLQKLIVLFLCGVNQRRIRRLSFGVKALRKQPFLTDPRAHVTCKKNTNLNFPYVLKIKNKNIKKLSKSNT